jgi:hypothetical protein
MRLKTKGDEPLHVDETGNHLGTKITKNNQL